MTYPLSLWVVIVFFFFLSFPPLPPSPFSSSLFLLQIFSHLHRSEDNQYGGTEEWSALGGDREEQGWEPSQPHGSERQGQAQVLEILQKPRGQNPGSGSVREPGWGVNPFTDTGDKG